MSNFINRLKTVWGRTEYRGDAEFCKLPNGFSVGCGVSSVEMQPNLREHHFLMSYTLRGRSTPASVEMDAMRDKFIEAAKEELFGHIRAIERRLYIAVYARKFDDVIIALNDLHKEIT